MSRAEAFRQPATAALAAGLFFSGVTFASTLPYNGIAGIEALGIPNEIYAVVITIGSVVSAIASVALGHLSDKVRDRRILVIATALCGAIGYGLLYFVRTQWAFYVTFGIFMPFGYALFSQTFSFARSFYDLRYPRHAEFMSSMLRTVFAIAWVIVPPVAGWIAATYAVFDLYGIAALAYLAICAIFIAMMRDERTRIGTAGRPASESAMPAPRGRVELPVIIGIAGVTITTVAVQISIVTTPLAIINDFGGNLGHVGINAALAAALEIPCMVLWGFALARFPKYAIIAFNAALYGLYLALLSQAQTVTDVYILQILNAVATAALMSIPITYMQDAIKGRVGLSTSLLDVVRVIASLGAAAIFGLLSVQMGYLAVFIAGAGLAGLGAATMLVAHLPTWRRANA